MTTAMQLRFSSRPTTHLPLPTPQVHVYEIVEHGRHIYLQLCFSSRSNACLTIPPQPVPHPSHPQVHVYEIVEHGRHFYPQLCFSSRADACLASLDAHPAALPGGRRGQARMVLGEPQSGPGSGSGSGTGQGAESGPSLVITRQLSAELGLQTYVPARLLQVRLA